MKNKFLLLALMLGCANFSFSQTREFKFENDAKKEGLTIEQNSESGIKVRYALKNLTISDFSDNGFKGQVIHGVSADLATTEPGDPNLPVQKDFIALPNGSIFNINIEINKMSIIENVDLLPSPTETYYKDELISTYEKNMEVYNKDAFFPESPISVSDKYKLRGVDATLLTIIPYQYNPVSKQLIVLEDVTVTVDFAGGEGHVGYDEYRSPYWDPILRQVLINPNILPHVEYAERYQEYLEEPIFPKGCEYLIVIPNDESFRPIAETLANFRREQGVVTKVKSLREMHCTSAYDIKYYLRNAYREWMIKPVAVCLMGDCNCANASVFFDGNSEANRFVDSINNAAVEGVPSVMYMRSETYNTHYYSGYPNDIAYSDVNDDHFPVFVISRMPARNAEEARVMVEKTIEYEKYPCMNSSYYDHPTAMMMYSGSSTGFQITSMAVHGFLANKLGKHPSYQSKLENSSAGTLVRNDKWGKDSDTAQINQYVNWGYMSSHPSDYGNYDFWNSGNITGISNTVNCGSMLVTYNGHSGEESTCGPRLSVNDADLFHNVGKLSFLQVFGCLSGRFNIEECLVEKYMRYQYNGHNAGFVGGIASSPSTSYSYRITQSMFQYYDPSFKTDNEPCADSSNWVPAFALTYGKNSLFKTASMAQYIMYYKDLHAFCDAFLRLYSEVPAEMNVVANLTGSNTLNIKAPKGAIIALSKDDGGMSQILAVTEATGSNQTVYFPHQPAGTRVHVVVTKQNYLRNEFDVTVDNSSSIFACGSRMNLCDGYNRTITIYPSADNKKVSLSGFMTSGNFSVTVYKGETVNPSKCLGTLSTRNTPFPTITASDEDHALTLVFHYITPICTCYANIDCIDLSNLINRDEINYSGVEDVPETDMVIYPNPANSTLTIENCVMEQVIIYNSVGQVVFDKEVEGEVVTINTSDFSNGLYVVNVYTKEGCVVKKISVLH